MRTCTLGMPSDFFEKLLPETVGFDRWTSTMENMDKILRDAFRPVGKYPPYNIVKYLDDTYRIEMAVAGFDVTELAITVADSTTIPGTTLLTVTGKKQEEPMPDDAYLHRGIAGRDFTREFTLAENVEVSHSNLIKGILYISLKVTTPTKKAKSVPISSL